MLSRPNRFGFSLVEAVMAAFMLLGAVLISVSVFDRSLQVEASNEKRIIAALVAETALAEIRQAASTGFGGIQASYDGRTWSIAEYPDFRITARVAQGILAVPCTELESVYNPGASFPAPAGRFLNNSAWKVQLDVTWNKAGNQKVTIVEQVVNFTPATNFELEVLHNGAPVNTSTVISVPRGGTERFSVRATSNGNSVRDVQFTWYVEALTGFGSIRTVSRDGLNCEYQNQYRNYRNEPKYSPGNCHLVVAATYQGREAKAKVMIKNES